MITPPIPLDASPRDCERLVVPACTPTMTHDLSLHRLVAAEAAEPLTFETGFRCAEFTAGGGWFVGP